MFSNFWGGGRNGIVRDQRPTAFVRRDVGGCIMRSERVAELVGVVTATSKQNEKRVTTL